MKELLQLTSNADDKSNPPRQLPILPDCNPPNHTHNTTSRLPIHRPDSTTCSLILPQNPILITELASAPHDWRYARSSYRFPS